MRKALLMAVALCAAISLLAGTALAADTNGSAAVTDSSDNASDSAELLPVDVIHYPERLEVRKIYELSPGVDPERLPRDGFERGGYAYECADILREVVIGEESKTVTVTETAESKKNDTNTVLALLPQFKEVTDEDGFAGMLLLNTATIKSEVSGYGSSSTAYTVTRSYPNLSDADTQYIPKTIDDNGKTLQFQDVRWQTDNTMNMDDYEIGDRFTAIATYGGTKTSSYVKGYTITADYTGEVTRKGVTVIRYTVIFTGTEIPAPVPSPSPEITPTPDADTTSGADGGQTSAAGQGGGGLPILISVLALLGSGAGMTYTALKNRKEKTHEKTSGYDYPDTYADGDGGDPGSGGGEF
jgi:hypothetical protein